MVNIVADSANFVFMGCFNVHCTLERHKQAYGISSVLIHRLWLVPELF